MKRQRRGSAVVDEVEEGAGFVQVKRDIHDHIKFALNEIPTEGSLSARNSLINFVLCKIYARDQINLLMLEENEMT